MVLSLPFEPIVTFCKIFSVFEFSQQNEEGVMNDEKEVFSIDDDITHPCVLHRSFSYTSGKKPIS